MSSRPLHVVPHAHDPSSGATYVVVRLCQALAARGVSPKLLTCQPGPPPEEQLDVTLFREWYPGRGLNVPFGLKKVFDGAFKGVDLLHCHGLWLLINVRAGREALRRGRRLVISPHGNLGRAALKNGTWAKRAVWHLAQKELLERSAFVHASGFTEAESVRDAGIRAPIAMIPNGVDVPREVRRTRTPRRGLLFLARLHPIKGLETLLRVWKELEAGFPGWELRIAGPDNAGHEQEMRALASSLGLSRVQWLGAVYGEEKSRAFSAASLYVLPTKGENFGVTIAEALGHALPVVVTKSAPWSEIPERRCGWWIDTGERPLLDTLEEALGRRDDELSEMGERGREWVRSSLSWESVAEKMVLAYEWAVRGGLRPSFIEGS